MMRPGAILKDTNLYCKHHIFLWRWCGVCDISMWFNAKVASGLVG